MDTPTPLGTSAQDVPRAPVLHPKGRLHSSEPQQGVVQRRPVETEAPDPRQGRGHVRLVGAPQTGPEVGRWGSLAPMSHTTTWDMRWNCAAGIAGMKPCQGRRVLKSRDPSKWQPHAAFFKDPPTCLRHQSVALTVTNSSHTGESHIRPQIFRLNRNAPQQICVAGGTTFA